MNTFKSIAVFPHHIKKSVCGSRAKYRDGRKDTAVKVYTINQESVYLLVTNVPAVGAGEELRALCDQYGIVSYFQPLDDYQTEEYTEAYLLKYDSFTNARVAKKQLDDKVFFGSALHVFYAPEFETVAETRLKLQTRRKYIAWKTNSGNKLSTAKSSTKQSSRSFVSKRFTSDQQPETYIWAGKEYTVQPPPSVNPDMESSETSKSSSGIFVPRQCQSNIAQNLSKLVNNSLFGQNLTLPKSRSSIEDPSYQQTISQVRAKVSSVSVPNVRVSLKRRKRLV